ncbi:MAG TPA: pyruvate, water dikinase regulatory protein [Arenimonas sp.]|uniref:posphoenolpyruvate synthetase regulatory kinase/phosphorylase PpsR n=1 Tax=Arenimonas sp. TaxID=1872635 RepID=UPI002D80ED5C|nr:pyruvate, water dikinase regulatory protein [Arenimonas sp.]HEU0153727.1 pyruvate, water dikinase regulatory protein [Arenimonas sp.]
MTAARPVFYVSDGTGITAETIGHSLLTQFSGVEFQTRRIAFVDSVEKAEAAVSEIRRAGQDAGCRPVVVNTVVDPDLNHLLAESGALMLDVFAPFISPLEQELGVRREARVGHAHGMVDFKAYESRINATNYALTHDDGMDIHYDDADVILVGVSRSGKTPTCLYMALHYGVKAANYPLTEEDLEGRELPRRLRAHRRKLFGLTIDPERLQQIRNERRPNSRYATIDTCRFEVQQAEALFRQENIPALSTTHTSIEEIAGKVLAHQGIHRHMF